VNDAVRTQLRQIVITYGLEICEDPRRVEALLRDLAAGYRREIAVLVGAVREGVPAELLAAKNRVLPAVLGERLARMLQDNLGLADEVARWAVSTWASALDVTGLALSDAGPLPPTPAASERSVGPQRYARGHNVIEVTEQTFNTDVVERSRTTPVIMDLWAEWCGPCKQLSPVLEKFAAEADGRWILAKVDVDVNPQLVAALQVESIPMVVAVIGGQLVDGFLGAMPESQLREWLLQVLPR